MTDSKDTYDIEGPGDTSAPSPESESAPEPKSTDEPDSAEIFDVEDDSLDACPNCGEAWPSDDTVVCMKCGLNLRTNEKAPVATGDEKPVEIEEPPPPGVLCAKGTIPLAWIGGTAGVILLIAAVLGGFTIEADGWTYTFATTLRRFLFGIAATGTGVLSIIFTARLSEDKIGDLAEGAARIGLAVSIGLIGWSLPWRFPTSRWLVYPLLMVILYVVAMRILFWRAPHVPRKILPSMHFLLLIAQGLVFEIML